MRALMFECSYCGAAPGQACVVTLAPEVGPLSIRWNHRAREEGGKAA